MKPERCSQCRYWGRDGDAPSCCIEPKPIPRFENTVACERGIMRPEVARLVHDGILPTRTTVDYVEEARIGAGAEVAYNIQEARRVASAIPSRVYLDANRFRNLRAYVAMLREEGIGKDLASVLDEEEPELKGLTLVEVTRRDWLEVR